MRESGVGYRMQQVQTKIAERENAEEEVQSCKYESGHMVKNHMTVIRIGMRSYLSKHIV